MVALKMSVSEVEGMPFNELYVFSELYKRDMEKRKTEIENARSGKKMIDMKDFMASRG